jgi:tetratricopeptide (TPR) repeat protein
VNPTAEDTYNQYMYMLPYIAMTRMGKWQEILDDPTSVHPDWKYAGILYDFAKGMAYAKTGNSAKAENHLQALLEKQKDQQLRKKFTPYMSSPYECSIIAENILLANIEFQQKKYTEAITSIKKAIMAEDSLIYSEPNLWMLPARQYLGAFLLTMNKPNEAEKIYREDLMWNPGNGWSMLGLYQSLTAQNKKTELNKIKERFEYSFSKADELPTASAY